MADSLRESSGTAWVCSVCGYVHRGATPPETCPVCGASASDFQAQEERSGAPTPVARSWSCLICGYVHSGETAPETCPVCGAAADEFERIDDTKEGPPCGQTGTRRIVIVGGGIAGVAAAASARDACPDAAITLVCKESELPYYRLNLTRYLAGEVAVEQLPIHPESWYAQRHIRLLSGEEVAAIEPEAHAVHLASGAREPYDKLILACGAHPFVPPIAGASLKGVTALRTHGDADHILKAVCPGSPWVVIGGGILGLETAGALAQRGAEVTVIENFDWLLPRQLDEPAAQRLHAFVVAKGIQVRYQGKTDVIEGVDSVEAVRLVDGTRVPAAGVVIAAGVRPNSHLARKAGLDVKQGVVVDAHLAASHPDVFAAGDVAEHLGVVYGLWEPARYQGAIAGLNAAGVATEFGGLPRANTLKVLGIDLFSIGTVMPADGSFTLIREDMDGGYYAFLFRDQRLAGAILLGDTRLSGTLAKALKSRLDCSKLLGAHPRVADVLAFFGEA